MINQCEIKYKCYRAYTTKNCKYFVQDVIDCKYLDHQLNCNCKEAQKEALADES